MERRWLSFLFQRHFPTRKCLSETPDFCEDLVPGCFGLVFLQIAGFKEYQCLEAILRIIETGQKLVGLRSAKYCLTRSPTKCSSEQVLVDKSSSLVWLNSGPRSDKKHLFFLKAFALGLFLADLFEPYQAVATYEREKKGAGKHWPAANLSLKAAWRGTWTTWQGPCRLKNSEMQNTNKQVNQTKLDGDGMVWFLDVLGTCHNIFSILIPSYPLLCTLFRLALKGAASCCGKYPEHQLDIPPTCGNKGTGASACLSENVVPPQEWSYQ